jgi:hypothetical protein
MIIVSRGGQVLRKFRSTIQDSTEPTRHLTHTHRVHRVATAAFWRTFSGEGKISPGW